MPRNRIIYQSEALYVGPAPATGYHYGSYTPGIGGSTNNPNGATNLVKQLQRVQTANYSFNIDRTDVNQFGQLAAIDRVILTNPTVSLDFSYLLANLANESGLGFTISTPGTVSEVSAISGILNKTEDQRNYFIKTVSEGSDATNNAATGVDNGVIGIGNAFVTSYSSEASVGNFPTVTINAEGLNMNFVKGTSGNNIPAVNPLDGSTITNVYTLPTAIENTALSSTISGISALRPGDITLSIPMSSGGGADTALMNVQSYTLSFELGRTPIQRLGSKFAFAREIDFPVNVTLSVEAQVTDLVTGSLSTIVNNDSAKYTPTITIVNPTNSSETIAEYKLKGAKLDSQEFSSDIGSNKTVTLQFTAQVGGPQDTNNGLFISGRV